MGHSQAETVHALRPQPYSCHEELVHARSEGHEIVALIPSDKRVAPGDKIQLGVPHDKLHVFDPESEESLVV